MLVLTRKKGQRICLRTAAGPITIQVVCCGGRAVRIGIEAPPGVAIAREEIADRPQLAKSA
jgi:carbon storage regulator CsrA